MNRNKTLMWGILIFLATLQAESFGSQTKSENIKRPENDLTAEQTEISKTNESFFKDADFHDSANTKTNQSDKTEKMIKLGNKFYAVAWMNGIKSFFENFFQNEERGEQKHPLMEKRTNIFSKIDVAMRKENSSFLHYPLETNTKAKKTFDLINEERASGLEMEMKMSPAAVGGTPRPMKTAASGATRNTEKAGTVQNSTKNFVKLGVKKIRYKRSRKRRERVKTKTPALVTTGMKKRIEKSEKYDYAFDCDNATIESGKKLFSCFNNMVWLDCNDQPMWMCNQGKSKCGDVTYTGSYIEYTYSTLMTHGVSFDYMASRQGIGRVWTYIEGEPYVLHCPKIKIKLLETETCFNDDIKMATDGKRILYVTRSKFLTKKINKKPCEDDTELEKGKRMATYRQTILLSSELMALWIWHDVSSTYILSKVFGLKSISTILLNEESYLSGYSKGSIITLMHLAWRRLSPYIIFSYGSIKIIWSLIIFGVGLKKRLGFCHSLAFVFNPVKHYNDLNKIILEKKLTKENEVSRSFKAKLNKIGELGLSEVSHFHLSALYENAICTNKKIYEMAERLERAERELEANMANTEKNSSQTTTNTENDSITTVSSEGSVTMDAKNEKVTFTK